jgi:uncharacterized protein YndB with AHSA1/START domain
MASGGPLHGDKLRPAVTVQRHLPMARARLFELWTDPVHLARWWGPVGWRVVRCETDLRLKGRWQTVLLTGSNETRSIGGQYLEIVPPERLVFTWEFPASTADVEPQVTVVTVTFLEEGDGTLLQLEHQKLAGGQAVDMDIGWNSTMDALQQYIDDVTANQSHRRE